MAARHPGAPPPVPMFHRKAAWLACIALVLLGIALALTVSPAWWQSGYAADCKSAYAGSIPTQASISRTGSVTRSPTTPEWWNR